MSRIIDVNALARREVYKLLEESLIEIDAKPGIVKYKDTLTDEKIANKVLAKYPHSDMSTGKVSGLRFRAWGELDKPLSLEQQLKLVKEENERLRSYLASIPNSESQFQLKFP